MLDKNTITTFFSIQETTCMNKQDTWASLQYELKDIMLSGTSPDNEAQIYHECARQALDCFDDFLGAIEDAAKAIECAEKQRLDSFPFYSLYCRALFNAEKFDEIIDFISSKSLTDTESSLWKEMSLFSKRGVFPIINSKKIHLYSQDILFEYAFLAYQNGFSKEARMAAANAKSFVTSSRCDRVIAETWFDESNFKKASKIYKKLASKDLENMNDYVRYIDMLLIQSLYSTALDFIQKNPPSELLLKHLLLFNCAALMNNIILMKKSLVSLGLIVKGFLYYQKRTTYFRIINKHFLAHNSLLKAREFLPKRMEPPVHEKAIALALTWEETLLKNNYAMIDALYPYLENLPISEKLLYSKAFSEIIPEEENQFHKESWTPMKSKFFKPIVFLMLLLLIFLIMLETIGIDFI